MSDTTANRWFGGRRIRFAAGRVRGEAPAQGGRRREREGQEGHGGRGGWDPRGFGPFGLGGPGGPFGRFPFGRGPKVKRGDVRAAALLLLAEDPRNGYQLMQEIESRSSGLWRPSPGSMYPVLQQLEDEGLVRPLGPEGRRVYELTDEGRAYVRDHREELGEPWTAVADTFGEKAADFHGLIVQVVIAARMVSRVGTRSQQAEAEELLVKTRRNLYRILAGDAGEVDAEEDDGTEER